MSAVATLDITAIGGRGDGLARDGEARVAVPFTLPGERVRAAIADGRGALIEILAPSPERIAPECRHFGTCGGCALQHWAAPAVAEWKRARIVAALARAGLSPPVTPTIDAHGAGRRRVTLHIRRHTAGIAAGFMRQRSHDLVDLDHCPLLVPALAPAPDIARAIGHVLRGLAKPLDLLVTASDSGLDCDIRGAGALPEALRQKLVVLAARFDLARLTLHGERLIEARMPTIRFADAPELSATLPSGAFLQATAEAEARLAALASTALGEARHVADLFCGLGPFTLRLARRMKVAGYDSDSGAIAALARSIRANPGGKPARAEARDLFRRPLFAAELKPFDAVLLDPPRQGAEAQAREIAKSRLARLAYVSCDPESFARDAAILAAGGFRIETVTPVDQFRHSPHVELVAQLSR
ncbi:class I SAM-dependent RNA methyltransferase [Rhabdaerophilum calidifontis]|uniref:class I SAM-dependent RNA methyltransferase n=1 Tax=Rhabdaerophilum calidifontis TaxID=2604328 RepID=UPI00123B7D72|nr:class I SAM-dependent RNA methyltransferase [Rhabdaerophilum calidifontis]